MDVDRRHGADGERECWTAEGADIGRKRGLSGIECGGNERGRVDGNDVAIGSEPGEWSDAGSDVVCGISGGGAVNLGSELLRRVLRNTGGNGGRNASDVDASDCLMNEEGDRRGGDGA